MTEPLAHLEDVLNTVLFDIEQKKAERDRLSAKIDILEDYRWKLKDALEKERAKRSSGDSPMGDK